MKTYVKKNKVITTINSQGMQICIPCAEDNDQYKAILKEVAADEAVIVDYVSDDSEKWGVIRAKRNVQLLSCDWRVLPDIVHNQDWLEYRQLLRNIPASNEEPDAIVWPIPPTD